MDKEEKLAQLMQESKLLFINEERERLNQIMITLLNYRLHRRDEEACELERFFHSLKGTSATLEFDQLSSLGKEYEDYFSTVNKSKGPSERFFLKILDGLARVYEILEGLYLQYNCRKGTDEENAPTSGSNVDNGSSLEDKPKDVSEGKKRILLVDDVNVIVRLMEDHLNALDYEVFSAKNGEEGIRKCKTLKPDLMLVDLMLPKVDGFEVCRRIKSDLETKDTKIIVISSKNKKEDVLKSFQAGIDDYMVKPFSMRELEQRVKKLLSD